MQQDVAPMVKNPKDILGGRKSPVSCVPAIATHLTGLALLSGALKYGRHNWRTTPVVASIYYDAAMRHLAAWWEGQETDPESGLPHLSHALASLAILVDADSVKKLRDDRPPKGNLPMELFNAKAKDMIDNCKEPKAPNTEKSL